MKFKWLIVLIIVFASCAKQKVDLILFNGKIYTIDSAFTIKESFAVLNGKIIATGSSAEISWKYESDSMLDAKGLPVFPGLFDAHCHFYYYGLCLRWIDLKGTLDFDEVIQRITEQSQNKKSEWILGRGWDQNDWAVKEFPNKKMLDSIFPDRPVFLKRIDGHAALANKTALDRAYITSESTIKGGIFEKKEGTLTGILIDNAVDVLEKMLPKPNRPEMIDAMLKAQKNCFAVGLTTVDDAGLDMETVELMDSLQKAGILKMRIYAMLNPNELNFVKFLSKKPYSTGRLYVRSFKFYADGALGSRGALLKKPYSDKPDHIGLQITSTEELVEMARKIHLGGFQMNTHCIGDSAVKILLGIYSKEINEPELYRWRIEHAQVVDPDDLQLFGKYQIIPSVQPTHATSDMYWAVHRLDSERVKHGYAYKELLSSAGRIALGSDFPVESINPLLGFYAAVSRKDLNGFPEGGFQMENALSREEALKGMTIWAAYANFEDKIKGSIEPGKYADFIILDNDIMTIPIEEVPEVSVLKTYVGGERVF